VAGLIDVKGLRYLWHASRIDFAAAGVALGDVLLMGVLDGVIIAVLAAAAMLHFGVTRPHVAFLGWVRRRTGSPTRPASGERGRPRRAGVPRRGVARAVPERV